MKTKTKPKKYPKTEKLQRKISITAGIVAIASILLIFTDLYNFGFNTLAKEPDMLILCEGDNEILYRWWCGISLTEHEYCAKCGKSIEEVGIIVPEKCLECNASVKQEDEFCHSCGAKVEDMKLRSWLNERECKTLKEYTEGFRNTVIKHVITISIFAVFFVFGVIALTSSEELAEKSLRKRRLRMEKKWKMEREKGE